MEKTTAKTFERPLLEAMCKVTEGNLETGVKISDLYQPICDQMGFKDVRALGYLTGQQPAIARWIQWAGRTLADKQLLRVESKIWYITSEGVLEAQKDVMSKTTEATGAQAPPVTAEVFERAALPEVLPAPYHTNPHFVGLAIQATPCFANYAAEQVCYTCPLAVLCHGQTKAPVVVAPDPYKEAQPPAEAKAPHRTFLVNVEMHCRTCGGPLAVGSRGAWIEGSREVVHLECL